MGSAIVLRSNAIMLMRSLKPHLTRSVCSQCSKRLPYLLQTWNHPDLKLENSRHLHVYSRNEYPIRPLVTLEETKWEKLKSFMAWHTSKQVETRKAAVYIYESCVDKVEFGTFVKYLKLKDTFLSWFFITELHLWMCMTRAMAEPDPRRSVCLQRELVRSLWSDTDTRFKKLAHMSSSVKREAIQNLSEHFQAMLLIYDEGLQGDDMALAGALWRVMLMCEGNDPQAVETLVHYVRKQVHMLDNMTLQEFLSEGRITWTPLLDCLPDDLE